MSGDGTAHNILDSNVYIIQAASFQNDIENILYLT